jgi:hypothetical protein
MIPCILHKTLWNNHLLIQTNIEHELLEGNSLDHLTQLHIYWETLQLLLHLFEIVEHPIRVHLLPLYGLACKILKGQPKCNSVLHVVVKVKCLIILIPYVHILNHYLYLQHILDHFIELRTILLKE